MATNISPRNAAPLQARRHHDFEGADGRRVTPGPSVGGSPADDRVPAAGRQFLAPLGAVSERERHAEGTRHRPPGLCRIDRDEAELSEEFERFVAVIEPARRIVSHEFWYCRLNLGTEHLAQQVGTPGKGAYREVGCGIETRSRRLAGYPGRRSR